MIKILMLYPETIREAAACLATALASLLYIFRLGDNRPRRSV